MDAQSERLTNITGWSRMENQEGKFWKQSDLGSKISYLPCCPKNGFEYIQTYKFSLEGQIFYLFSIKYEVDQMRIFVITSSSFEKLKNIITAADGQPYNAPDIQFCNYLTKSRDGGDSFDLELFIQNKELIRKLLLNEDARFLDNSNSCRGNSLFLINSQVLKGEKIVRFNIIPWANSVYKTIPLTDDYFELKKSDFEKLLKFSAYLKFNNQLKIDQQLKKLKEDIVIKKLQSKYDSLNSISYIAYSAVNGYNVLGREYLQEVPRIINPGDFTSFIDSTTFENKKEFNIIVGADGKIIQAPIQVNLFNQFLFAPGKVAYDYKENDLNREYEHYFGDCSGKCAVFARNMEIPVSFSQRYNYEKPETTTNKIIIKLKKTKNNEIEVDNNYYNDIEFMKKVRPTIKLANEFATYSPGKYYFYFTRKTTYWNITLFPSNYTKERVNNAGSFSKAIDIKEIKVFNSSNFDERCP